MKVNVDNSETLAAADRAGDLVDSVVRSMRASVELAAAYELQHKTYQDRTNKLRRGTRGRIERRGGVIHAIFELDTEYASYVNRRGFSSFNEAGVAARDAIQDAIDAIGRQLTSG